MAFALTLVTLIVEAIGGYLSGSLALLADAGHMLVDALALLFAWLGARFAKRAADERRSYGYARVEVLVGYTNALAQFVLVAWIGFEAISRLFAPAPILSGLMLWVAISGLAVNGLVLRMLHGHDENDLNTAGARLHVMGDLLGSLGAVVAASLIAWFDWLWADPAISILVSLLILRSAWRLLARSAHILLEGAPQGLGAAQLSEAVTAAGIGVDEIHHVHVWELAGGRAMATLHARIGASAEPDTVLAQLRSLLRERFGIVHVTVQIESTPCRGEQCGGLHG
ncbi:cation diffusion facilitator family transporter [Dokdonella sp.]|uniref:cation diffusion facilitator family transporter n=1 Tax=Dokdonella sp. TaxID=2291710 RepID=UPI0031F32E89